MAPRNGEQSRFMRTEGAAVTARRERLGMEIAELADEAQVNRDTLSDWEAGHTRPQSKTERKVLGTLARLEEEMGIDAPPAVQPGAGVIRYVVQGVYGAEALVVEGPVANIAELEASVDRIMRRIQGRREGPPDPAP